MGCRWQPTSRSTTASPASFPDLDSNRLGPSIMRGKALLPALIIFVLSSAGCSTKAPDDGTKPLQGTWLIFDPQGKNTNRAAIFERDLFQFIDAKETKGGESTQTIIGAADHGTIRVDPAKSPAHLDFVYIDGENAGKTRPAI